MIISNYLFRCLALLILAIPLSISPILAQNIPISGDTTLCEGEIATLDAGNYAIFQWSTGAQSQRIQTTRAGYYSVTVTDSQGRTDSGGVTVTVYANPTVRIQGTPYLCPNRPTSLFVSGNFERILWSNGRQESQITVQQPGIYTVKVTDANGCSAMATDTVRNGAVAALPLPDTVRLCVGDSTVLDATAAGATFYFWDDDNRGPTLTVRDAGMYNVIVSNGQCVAYDTTIVEVLPLPDIQLGADTMICDKDTIQLCAPFSPLWRYEWSNGSQKLCTNVSEPAVYRLITTFGGCRDTAYKTVAVFNKYPKLTLLDTNVCDTSFVIKPQISGALSYRWTDGTVSAAYTVRTSGNYQVVASNGRCFVDAFYKVNFIPNLPLELGADTAICQDNQASFFIKTDLPYQWKYRWQDGSTQSAYTATATGLYTVVVDNGCKILYDSIYISFKSCHKVFVTNAFSPNGDGQNDFFQIYPTTDVAQIRHLYVFNRWGNQLFEAHDFDRAAAAQIMWDGRHRGQLVPPGVYVVRVEGVDTEGAPFSQVYDLTLMR